MAPLRSTRYPDIRVCARCVPFPRRRLEIPFIGSSFSIPSPLPPLACASTVPLSASSSVASVRVVAIVGRLGFPMGTHTAPPQARASAATFVRGSRGRPRHLQCLLSRRACQATTTDLASSRGYLRKAGFECDTYIFMSIAKEEILICAFVCLHLRKCLVNPIHFRTLICVARWRSFKQARAQMPNTIGIRGSFAAAPGKRRMCGAGREAG